MWHSTVCRRSAPSLSTTSSTRCARRSQPGKWMVSGAPLIFEARAAPRSTFSSSAVKSLLTPISPMIPAQTSGSSSQTPQSAAIASAMASTDILCRHSPDATPQGRSRRP